MDAEIARRRLRAQHLTGEPAESSAQVVSGLLAVQAENPSQSAWAVACRTRSPDPAALEALLASGEVLRTHVLRSTWHYVSRDDLDRLLALTSPRVLRAIGVQLDHLGPVVRERLTTEVVALLSERPDLTRSQVADGLAERVPEHPVDRHTLMILMAVLELERYVVSGAPVDGEHTYAAYGDRVGPPRDLGDRDEALAWIAGRYVAGHGPATEKDLAYWATLTPVEARRGLQAAEGLATFEHDGRRFFHDPAAEDLPDDATDDPRAHLLQVLDETYRGFSTDSRWVLDADGIVPRGRERAIGMLLVDGQLVASMTRSVSATAVRFDLRGYRELRPDERAEAEAAAAAYGSFLSLPATVRVDD